MLPSRGLTSRIRPASALRHSTKLPRSSHIVPRQFSQLSSQSRNAPLLRGAPTSSSRSSPIGAHGPSLASLRAGVGAGGGASIVFANRAGASRNLSWGSLWPFGSKKPPTSETTTVEPSAPSPSELEPDVSPEASAASPEITSTSPGVNEPSFPTEAADPGSFDVSQYGLDATSILDLPEQIGYLKSLGLDFGWGPTASAEWLLEHVYIYSGMPWWATLLSVATLWRVIMFVPTNRATKASGLLQLAHKQPEYAAAFEELKTATRAGDQPALLQARYKMKTITGRAGAQWWWIPAPFLTVPFTYGMFRLMRGMSAIPVPSLENGGMAWFTDLTVHDPYYILPIINVALGTYMFKQGQKAAISQTPQQQAMMNGFAYFLPPVVFFSTAWIPSGLQWFFVCLSGTTIAQNFLTFNPGFRRWAELPPLPTRPGGMDAASMIVQAKGSYEAPTARPAGSRNVVGNITKGVKESLGKTDDQLEWERAQEYEKRRAAEEKERKARRMARVLPPKRRS